VRFGSTIMFTACVLTLHCAGQEAPPSLPEAPSAQSKQGPVTQATEPVYTHRFWDRENVLLFSGVAASRFLDFASTKNFLARGRQEILLPDDIVYDNAGFAALEAAGTMTSVGISYVLHRYGHHKLERWLSIGHIGVTTFGAVRNYCLESRHPPRTASNP
jgi:hypothetical protein